MNFGYDDNIIDNSDDFDDKNNGICWQEGPIVIKKDQCTNHRKGGPGKCLLANMNRGLEITTIVRQT